MVSVFNGRGRFRARAVLADSVKPGVVVSLGLWWRKYTDDGVNCNSYDQHGHYRPRRRRNLLRQPGGSECDLMAKSHSTELSSG